MAGQLPAGSMFVDKQEILNGMHAIFLSLIQQTHLMNDDAYTMGYHEGFENALSAVAAIIGVEDDLQKKIVKQKTRQFQRMRVIAGQKNEI